MKLARDYEQYKAEVAEDIASVLHDAGCQPIIFVGSGFSKRYAKAPNWEELLRTLADACPTIDRSYAYYRQTYRNDLPTIAGIFADAYREWAWGDGKSEFPAEYFDESVPGDIFIKHKVRQLLKRLGPDLNDSYGSAELDAELEALKGMSPHAIVTTNYDELIEGLFPEFSRIIGQTILRQPYLSIGEIFKIHGCISEPESLVLTQADYAGFEKDQKYLSAKLLTYFAEHPLLFVGYRAADPNIRSVLYDVDRMIRAEFQLIPNIFILEYDPDIDAESYPATDRVLAVGDDREIRIKSISASDFKWVYEAFGNGGNLEKVNMKLLRALMARTVDLVRKDAPTNRVEIDFQTLDKKLAEGGSIATLLGITSLDHPSKVNISYPFSITDVAKELGHGYWYPVNVLMERIKDEMGVDIKASDNTYHITMMAGKKTPIHKYSHAAVALLGKIQKGETYELANDCINPRKIAKS
jgi:hypothetical protein